MGEGEALPKPRGTQALSGQQAFENRVRGDATLEGIGQPRADHLKGALSSRGANIYRHELGA